MQLPARIGKYELEEFLGGGMSHVYRARDTVIGRTVAVKILTEQGCEDPEAKARFLAEARMAGNLAHDNVLSIYDFGEDEQHHPLMVMEFLRGEDLRHAIKNGHTGDTVGKLKIAVQVARALQFIHTQKIIHRDIKPENIHITTQGVVKLMDFGIAKTEGLAMTRAGYVLGTPYYMAPEQVMGTNVTEQVDVYSFGILLFELMTGNKPIMADTVERIFYSILNEPLKLEPLQQAGVPQAVIDMVAACTAKNPAERPQGFPPVTAALERVIADLEAPTTMLPAAVPVPPPHNRWLLPSVIVLVVLLAAGLVFALTHKSPVVVVEKKGPELPKKPELPPTLADPHGDMVLVPDGEFLFGQNKEPVTLPAFYIDKTEVTNQAYADFCKATGHREPLNFKQAKPEDPVVYVTFQDAKAFADWAHKRIPTSREWEKAARGTDGRLFPWGNDADTSRAQIASKQLAAAISFPTGASIYGALNMVGNANEMVDELTTATPETIKHFKEGLNYEIKPGELCISVRGQGYLDPELSPNVLWDSSKFPADLKHLEIASAIGFRCVKDPPAAH